MKLRMRFYNDGFRWGVGRVIIHPDLVAYVLQLNIHADIIKEATKSIKGEL